MAYQSDLQEFDNMFLRGNLARNSPKTPFWSGQDGLRVTWGGKFTTNPTPYEKAVLQTPRPKAGQNQLRTSGLLTRFPVIPYTLLMGFLPVSKKISHEIAQFVTSPLFDPKASPESDPEWPRISVITPSYNQAQYLERTIWSIHNQSYPNLEHIVIDGGSNDESVKIIRKYENRLAYWHSRPDGGQSDAINTGASRATGKYMMWINSDDLLMPGALHKLVGAIKDDPAVDLVYGNQVEVDAADRVTKRVHTIDFDIRNFIYEINIIVHQQSALWKTDLFHRIGGLKLYQYAMDYDLFYRMYVSGARFKRIPDLLSAFRVHSEGLTGSGEVGRHRGEEVNAVFRDFTGRDRNILDRALLRYFFKARRFALQPMALQAAVENRLWGLLHWGTE